MAASQKDICKTRAAAMAATTFGRKTSFKSAKQVRTACQIADFEDEIEEALQSFRKGQKA